MNGKTRIGIIVVVLAIVAAALGVARQFMPVSVGAPTPQKHFIDTVSYSCNQGKTITASLYEGATTSVPKAGEPPVPTGSVDLLLSDGRMMTLGQTLSADGVRYANPDESFVFWTKGQGALVLEHNQEKSYIGCIQIAPLPSGSDLTRVYSNSQAGFSVRLPGTATSSDTFTIDSSYRYQNLGPGHDIYGVKFTIPASLVRGTNLGSDTYLSVEEIPRASECSATLFLDRGAKPLALDDGGMAYSVATSTGAGAGNRYEETVYAYPGTNPCVAIRYFVHYGVIENYPPGAVDEFDRQALLGLFDQIRRTVVVRQ